MVVNLAPPLNLYLPGRQSRNNHNRNHRTCLRQPPHRMEHGRKTGSSHKLFQFPSAKRKFGLDLVTFQVPLGIWFDPLAFQVLLGWFGGVVNLGIVCSPVVARVIITVGVFMGVIAPRDLPAVWAVTPSFARTNPLFSRAPVLDASVGDHLAVVDVLQLDGRAADGV